MDFPLVRIPSLLLIGCVFLALKTTLHSDIPLIGENGPYQNLRDGDFKLVPGWRIHNSPFWTYQPDLSYTEGESPAGITVGKLSSKEHEVAVFDSATVKNSDYPYPISGDAWEWKIVAIAEFECEATLTVSLHFGNRVKMLVKGMELPGRPRQAVTFSGNYEVTDADEAFGMPFVRIKTESEDAVNVFIYSFDLKVKNSNLAGPETFRADHGRNSAVLRWSKVKWASAYRVFRRVEFEKDFKLVSEIEHVGRNVFVDRNLLSGVKYEYFVTSVVQGKETSASEKLVVQLHDDQAPQPVINVVASAEETEITLNWKPHPNDRDIKEYRVYRGDEKGANLTLIADHLKQSSFVDDLPKKERLNTYRIAAIDYFGNEGILSEPVMAKVKTIRGATFSDLILPMPIDKGLTSELWGSDSVRPRNPLNGIEHPEWSYWGGNPTKGKDGDFHMIVVRWPEESLKGHWEWPKSTVVHAVSKSPTGPYTATNDAAYEFENGAGHNADIILLNDGRYLLYTTVHWAPTLFVSESMQGPWERVGEMDIRYDSEKWGDDRLYQVSRNLSGVQLQDGRLLFVTKFGRMMLSEGSDLLGPYEVLTETINKNETIPERYRSSNYEDPVIWRDEVQFHMIINAFLDYRAIYLRSNDGIHWKYDGGLAYTPESTWYEDGTQTYWYKLERPHVLQDEYGRATHLSLAAIDVPKQEDFGNDNHSSKNLILPLVVFKRLQLLSEPALDALDKSKEIRVLVFADKDFDPQVDLDLESLRFGASEVVNFGNGSAVLSTEEHDDGLVLVFSSEGNGITKNNFAAKLIGKTRTGELVVGYAKLY